MGMKPLEEQSPEILKSFYAGSKHLIGYDLKEGIDPFQRFVEQLLGELRTTLKLASAGIAEIDWNKFVFLPLAQDYELGVEKRVGPQNAGAALFYLPLREGGPELIEKLDLMSDWGPHYKFDDVDLLRTEPLLEDFIWTYPERAAFSIPIPLTGNNKLSCFLIVTNMEPRQWSKDDYDIFEAWSKEFGNIYSKRSIFGNKLVKLERTLNLEAHSITAREKQVLMMIAETGCTNQTISRSLGISERTAKAHISALLKKLNMQTRTELAAVGRIVLSELSQTQEF